MRRPSLTKRRTSGHKQHVCFYCRKLEFKIPRHCEINHKAEELVAKALSFRKGSVDRREMWRKITADGDFKNNIKNTKNNAGTIIVARNKNHSNTDEYVPCTFCNNFSTREPCTNKHSKKCRFKVAVEDNGQQQQHLHASRAMLSIYLNDDKFNEIRAVLAKMKKNEIHIIIRNDPSLLLYGTVQLQKKETYRYSDVRSSLRVLAKLLREFRIVSSKESATASQLVSSLNYDSVLQAAKYLAGYSGPRQIETPLLMLKCGFCLTNFCQYLRCAAMKANDSQALLKTLESFPSSMLVIGRFTQQTRGRHTS